MPSTDSFFARQLLFFPRPFTERIFDLRFGKTMLSKFSLRQCISVYAASAVAVLAGLADDNAVAADYGLDGWRRLLAPRQSSLA